MARLDELERKFEENPRRYFAPLANEYRKAGDAQRAADLCRSQLPEIPGHISGHIVLGQSLYDAGDFPGSRAALETALALDPENIVALRYLGDIARDAGDAVEAERWYSRTLEADPYNEAATIALQSLDDRPPPVPTLDALPIEVAEPATEPTVQTEPPPVEETIESAESAESAEFSGDLEISAASELTEPDPGESASPEPPTERFDVEAHAPPEPVPVEESIQAEERVMESAAPFVTETMADLYMEQGYPHEALELLLQLSEQRPQDEQLRAKIEQIESVIVARRDAAVAVARAERAETTEAAEAASEPSEAVFSFEMPPSEPAPDAPISVREMFARMDKARPKSANAVTPRPLARLRSDFVPMPDAQNFESDDSADPFAFPNTPSQSEARPDAVPRTSGPHPTFNPSTAEIEDFDAWLRGLRGP